MQGQMPIIAMPQLGFSPRRIYMKSKYVQSLRRAGARVRWISLRDPARAAAQTLQCDGLLMPGGPDLAPSYYGCATEPGCGKINPVRDAAEWRILDAWLPTGKPLLGICRGIQMLNAFCGGTLQQDITPDQKCPHMDFPNRAKGTHSVHLVPGTRLTPLLGGQDLTVNSMHHQVVGRLAEGFVVSAFSEDGYIEAMEDPSQTFRLAVQWHPEHMSRTDARQQALFNAFVEACRSQGERHA